MFFQNIQDITFCNTEKRTEYESETHTLFVRTTSPYNPSPLLTTPQETRPNGPELHVAVTLGRIPRC